MVLAAGVLTQRCYRSDSLPVSSFFSTISFIHTEVQKLTFFPNNMQTPKRGRTGENEGAVQMAPEKEQKREVQQPWLSQGLVVESVGNRRVMAMGPMIEREQSILSSWLSGSRTVSGGLKDGVVFWEALRANLTAQGRQSCDQKKKYREPLSEMGVNKLFLGADERTKKIVENLPAQFDEDAVWEEKLIARGKEQVAYSRATGDHLPKPGCWDQFGRPTWPSNVHTKPIRIPTSAEPLPYVAKSSRVREEDAKKARDRFVRYMIDTGHLREWLIKRDGFPTVVCQIDVVFQKGEYRAVTDLRYLNGSVPCVEIQLPSMVEIAKELEPGDLMMKVDLKLGYHQCMIDPRDQHLVVIEYEGGLFAFTTLMLGLRSAPGDFQNRTSAAARVVEQLNFVKKVKVYLDDFIIIAKPPKNKVPPDRDKVVQVFQNMGMVLGKKKVSTEFSARMEVLGLIIDNSGSEVKIEIPEEKLDRLRQYLRVVTANGGKTTTKNVAATLGLAISFLPAAPVLQIFLRDAYDDLTMALGRQINVWRENDASLYHWEVKEMTLSTEALVYLGELLEKMPDLIAYSQSHAGKQADYMLVADTSETASGFFLVDLRKGSKVSLQVDLEALPPSYRKKASPWEGTKVELNEDYAALPLEFQEESSTLRESWGLAQAAKSLPAVIDSCMISPCCDNKGLCLRGWRGARDSRINVHLREMVEAMISRGVRVGPFQWLPRTDPWIVEADQISKREQGSRGVPLISPVAYRQVVQSSGITPNVDAYADQYNHVLPRYCSLNPRDQGASFNGLAMRWTAKDVPWMFPPMHILRSAIKAWYLSDSREGLICMPDVKTARSYQLAEFLGGIRRDNVKVLNAPGRDFVVFGLQKQLIPS